MEIRELQLLPDDKLAALAQSGNLDAEEALLKKYKDAVRIKANMYYASVPLSRKEQHTDCF